MKFSVVFDKSYIVFSFEDSNNHLRKRFQRSIYLASSRVLQRLIQEYERIRRATQINNNNSIEPYEVCTNDIWIDLIYEHSIPLLQYIQQEKLGKNQDSLSMPNSSPPLFTSSKTNQVDPSEMDTEEEKSISLDEQESKVKNWDQILIESDLSENKGEKEQEIQQQGFVKKKIYKKKNYKSYNLRNKPYVNLRSSLNNNSFKG